jgi:hypothetical protein
MYDRHFSYLTHVISSTLCRINRRAQMILIFLQISLIGQLGDGSRNQSNDPLL